MAFKLETLTDDQREAMGFARTMDDAKPGLGMSFVSKWMIDTEKDSIFIPVHVNSYELHWEHQTIFVRARFKPRITTYEVQQIVIPRGMENKESKIIKIIEEAFKNYGNGWLDKQSHLNGKTIFSPDIEIRYQDHVKSKVKLSDFATIQ